MKGVLYMLLGVVAFKLGTAALDHYNELYNNSSGRYVLTVGKDKFVCTHDAQGRICRDKRGIMIDLGEGEDYWTRDERKAKGR